MIPQIAAPALQRDQKQPPDETERAARAVIANLIHYLQHHGFYPYRVYDGAQHVPTFNLLDAMETIFSVGESRLHVKQPGCVGHTIILIPGNGLECVSDHSETPNDLDDFVRLMDEFDPESITL
jgi:hypothetical protein